MFLVYIVNYTAFGKQHIDILTSQFILVIRVLKTKKDMKTKKDKKLVSHLVFSTKRGIQIYMVRILSIGK